jgi:hypothetical protein
LIPIALQKLLTARLAKPVTAPQTLLTQLHTPLTHELIALPMLPQKPIVLHSSIFKLLLF